MLDASPVVPAPVEQYDLTRGRQMRDVPLEVPLALLPLRWGAEGDDPGVAGVAPLHDPLDGAPLARRVPALEDHTEPEAFVDDPLLHLHELGLEAGELGIVELGGYDKGFAVDGRFQNRVNSLWRLRLALGRPFR